MLMESADDFVTFAHVRVVRTTAPALFCAIGDKRVWLPRTHIKGNLWCRGDRGTLLVRRWVALDRHLAIPNAPDGISHVIADRLLSRRIQPGRLHALRRSREVHLGH